jgi:hypothetical protein
MVQNGFKPFFVGRFEVRNDVTVLTGHFGMSVSAKIFTTIWLAIVAVVAAGSLATGFSSRNSTSVWLPIAPLFMLVAGLGFVRLGKWFARNDAAWLSGVINQALGAPGGAVAKEPEIVPATVPLERKGVE